MAKKDRSLSIVGTGSGSLDNLSSRAIQTLEDADIILGYQTYIDQLKEIPEFERKTMQAYPMGSEIERCKESIKLAGEKNVAIISSGDAGVYGMAGPILELLDKEKTKINLELIPGIPSFIIASSLLGAPLMNDFCCISLSDYLTPWEDIKRRIMLAVKADFIIVLVNPTSKNKKEHLSEIKEIFYNERAEDRITGLVKQAGRDGEEFEIMPFSDLKSEDLTMSSLIIVGNSTTYYSEFLNRLISRRGYFDTDPGRND